MTKWLLIIWMFWIVVLFDLLTIYLPESVISDCIFLNRKVQKILPQGWGFFTKSPREDMFESFEIKNNEQVPLSFSNTSIQNLYGFSRSSRYISYETSNIFHLLKNKQWFIEKGNIKLPKVKKVNYVKISTKYYKRNSTYMIVKFKQTPWAWANYSENNSKPFEFIFFSIY